MSGKREYTGTNIRERIQDVFPSCPLCLNTRGFATRQTALDDVLRIKHMLHIRCDGCNALWRIETNSLLNQFTVTLSQKGRADYGVIVSKAQDLRYWNRVRARVRKRSGGERMTEDVRQAIDELFQAYLTGLRQGDVASVVALYTENAIQLPPDRTIIRGRPQLQASAN